MDFICLGFLILQQLLSFVRMMVTVQQNVPVEIGLVNSEK